MTLDSVEPNQSTATAGVPAVIRTPEESPAHRGTASIHQRL